MKYAFLILDKNELIKSAIAYPRYPIAGEQAKEARDEGGPGPIRLPDIPTFICFMIGKEVLHGSSKMIRTCIYNIILKVKNRDIIITPCISLQLLLRPRHICS